MQRNLGISPFIPHILGTTLTSFRFQSFIISVATGKYVGTCWRYLSLILERNEIAGYMTYGLFLRLCMSCRVRSKWSHQLIQIYHSIIFPSQSHTHLQVCVCTREFLQLYSVSCLIKQDTQFLQHALGASIWHPLNMSSRFSAVPHISTSVGLYCVFTNDIFPVIKSCNYMVLYRTSQFQEIGFPTSVIDRRVYHLYMEHLEYFRIFHVEAFYVRFQFPRHLLLELHVQWLYSISIEVAAFTIIWCRCYCGKFSVSFLYLVVKSPEVYSKRCTKYSNKARCFATNISCFFRSKE